MHGIHCKSALVTISSHSKLPAATQWVTSLLYHRRACGRQFTLKLLCGRYIGLSARCCFVSSRLWYILITSITSCYVITTHYTLQQNRLLRDNDSLYTTAEPAAT
jgi:hypothetical protein